MHLAIAYDPGNGEIILARRVKEDVPLDGLTDLINAGDVPAEVKEILWPGYGTDAETQTALGEVVREARDKSLAVLILSDGDPPDPEAQKVDGGELVDKTESELVAALKVKRVAEIKALAASKFSRNGPFPDWKVIRHRDQIAAGGATDLTDTEYKDLLTARQNVRDTSTQLEAEVNAKLKVNTIMAVDLSLREALA